MAQFELIMPKMGESIMEATILSWAKKEGDTVEMDDTIAEIATDKVDSEVPSPVSGTITKILFQVDDTVPVGEVIALINTSEELEEDLPQSAGSTSSTATDNTQSQASPTVPQATAVATVANTSQSNGTSGRFYSPLVKNIAQKENISTQELDQIPGTGAKGRVTKKDILAFISNRKNQVQPANKLAKGPNPAASQVTSAAASLPSSGQVEIVEMDRMRRLIADHMVMSKQTSPHVTSFIEVDVTNIVNWRNRIKGDFQKKYGQKITFTPIFIEAVARAIRDFPMVNISVDGQNIIVKKDINIGMAAALPSGNLIVPVIKQADQLNLLGLTKQVNDFANRARQNQLKPNEIQEGTFTITNVGTFGNVMGTPIINQPQVAILAVGAIRKKPAVVETEYGDVIAIRQLMFMSLSYDHRVVDGFLGGSFLRKIGDYLEAFDHQQTI